MTRKIGGSTKLSSNLPSVYIANVLPNSRAAFSPPPTTEGTLPTTRPSKRAASEPLEIASFRDVAVDEYYGWQQKHVKDEEWKANWREAGRTLKAARRDLQQAYEEQDYSALTDPLGGGGRHGLRNSSYGMFQNGSDSPNARD